MERKRFKDVGRKLLTRIDELRDDPDLFSLKDDAAYVTALMDARAEAAAEGVSLEQYKRLISAYVQARAKLGSPDFLEAFDQVGAILEDTLDEYQAAKDVVELIDKRVGLVEAEQRMMQSKAYTLEVDQAFSLMMQVLAIIKSNVHNPDELVAIKNGVARLLKVYKEDADAIMSGAVIDADVVGESQ